MINDIKTIRKNVREKLSLIHCITNPISINQCANAILAVGARPIMAEHPKEVTEITSSSSALLLNLGNITDVRMESMLKSAKTAKELGIPTVIDTVGIACSDLRRDFLKELVSVSLPTVIKGNYSEINALYDEEYSSSGVDADNTLDIGKISNRAKELSKRLGTVILASGKTDIISDKDRSIYVNNGTKQLSDITGTGCMQGALCAAFTSVSEGYEAALTACTVLGISGELSETKKGNGTFFVNLMDNLSTISDEDIEKYINTEVQ